MRIVLLGLLLAAQVFSVAWPAAAGGERTNGVVAEQVVSGSIAGVKFSCPEGFELKPVEKSYQAAYLRSREGDLALFLAIPPAKAGDEYVPRLGTFLASYLFPEEWAIFAWKTLGNCDKVSRFETSAGWLQGYNGSQRVALLYRSLSVEGKQVMAGCLFGLDRETTAATRFQQGVAGQSPAGQRALSQLIASITHEEL